MTSSETTKKLIDFIEKSPSVFHTAETIKGMLLGNNFQNCKKTNAGISQPEETIS